MREVRFSFRRTIVHLIHVEISVYGLVLTVELVLQASSATSASGSQVVVSTTWTSSVTETPSSPSVISVRIYSPVTSTRFQVTGLVTFVYPKAGPTSNILAEELTIRTLGNLILQDASGSRTKDILVGRLRSDVGVALVVGGQDRHEAALLDAALGAQAVDLVLAALDHGRVARLDRRRAVVERAVLRARGVRGAAGRLGVDIVARVREGEGGCEGQGKSSETEASHVGKAVLERMRVEVWWM